MQFPDRVQFLFAHTARFNSSCQRILQGRQPVADFGFAAGYLRLDLAYPGGDRFSASVAFSALVQQDFAVQRAYQVMIMILRAAFRGLYRHMAVRAAQHGRMLALQVGFQFRMLCLEHLRAGPRLLPVREAKLIIVGQDCFRRHFRYAVIGHHGLAVLGRKVILNMALSAGKRRGVDLRLVFSQRFVHILVRHDHLAVVSVIPAVAGIAGNGVGRLGHYFIEGHGIDADALLFDHLVHIRRLAGQAVGLGMGPLGFLDVFQRIGVTPGAAVILGKPVSFIDVHQIRILLQIIGHITVVLFIAHGKGNRGQHVVPA